ncbi:MAG TPA: geranylgeranyl reductase family protein [Actinomycetota bacterium]|nr:geranylgeranyl reductase family protein [Actinomycetota bacterium]
MAERIETDVLIVGAGPGGSAAAYHLARHGIDVTAVDKATFPRDKVCGDGLTPRSVGAIERMGVDTSDPDFVRIEGLRVHSKDVTIDLPWPELRTWPNYGLVMPRLGFDHLLVERARAAGARILEGTEATEPIRVDGWVRGATVTPTDDAAEPTEIHARFVVAADGAASRFAAHAGVRRDETRPLGIAARRYYRAPNLGGPWFESWLDLWEGDMLLPGYGWVFPLADGRVNLGAGLLSTFRHFKDISATRLFAAFARMLPGDRGISEETADGRMLSGPLPMSMNRTPQAVPGMLVVGDAAGAVNPMNGEGIAYAIETAEVAAELLHEALVNDRPAVAMMYPVVLKERYGRYFRLGRGFARLVGRPEVMGPATKYLLPSPKVMGFAMRMMANLTDGRDGDAQDKLFYVLERLARAS